MANDHSNKAFTQNQPRRGYILEEDDDFVPLNHTSSAVQNTLPYLHLSVKPPYRGPTGHYYLRGLFLETMPLVTGARSIDSPLIDELGARPIFTLKTYDYTLPSDSPFYREGGNNLLRSFHELYVQYSDPAEYTFATENLGSYEHWKRLVECSFFEPYLAEMRVSLDAKLESEALQAARKVAQAGLGPQSLQAAKWLHDAVKEPKTKRGRPSKDEVQGELRRTAKEQSELDSDLKRLGILNNG
jgi:hypothetical protein